MAWTQEPRSRLRRVLSNIEIEPVIDGADDGRLEVHSNFHLNELRSSTSTQVVWTGHTIHHLLPAGDGFQIALKKVLLLTTTRSCRSCRFFYSYAHAPALARRRRAPPFKDRGGWSKMPQPAFLGFTMPHVFPLPRLLCLIGLAVVLAACSRQSLPLRIATHPWVGYESLCLAQDRGVLPPTVTLRHGQRAADTLAALRAGTVDAGMLTLDEMLTGAPPARR